MKNAIMYYYNLVPNNIRQTAKYTKFSVKDDQFVLEMVERNLDEINELYELTLYLLKIDVPCHQIIPNINNSIITFINNQPHILMRVFVNSEQLITERDLLLFMNVLMDNHKYKKIIRNNLGQLWSSKIDYLEYQVSQFGKKYNVIRDSFGYYIGLAENALQFYKTIKNNVQLCISHRRIKKDCTMYDLYNPLEFVLDTRVRDFCEYYKQKFFYDDIPFENFKTLIYSNNLSENEIKLLFCRLLFPTTYFDMYESVVVDNIDERELIPIVTKTPQYEAILKKIYTLLFQYYHIDVIEWLSVGS